MTQYILFNRYKYKNSLFEETLNDVSDLDYDKDTMYYIELIYKDLQKNANLPTCVGCSVQLSSLPETRKMYKRVIDLSGRLGLYKVHDMVKSIYPFSDTFSEERLYLFTVVNGLFILAALLLTIVTYISYYEYDATSLSILAIMNGIVVISALIVQMTYYIPCIFHELNFQIEKIDTKGISSKVYVYKIDKKVTYVELYKRYINTLFINCTFYDAIFILTSLTLHAFVSSFMNKIASAIIVPGILFVMLLLINAILLNMQLAIYKGYILNGKILKVGIVSE